MKLKTFISCVAMILSAFGYAAVTRHTHELPAKAKAQTEIVEKMMLPGYCEIEIINRSFEPVYVSGTFIDGAPLYPFYIYPYEAPHYISLQYWGCQNGMYLTISSPDGYVLYSGFTPVYQVINLYPGIGKKQTMMKIQPKSKV